MTDYFLSAVMSSKYRDFSDSLYCFVVEGVLIMIVGNIGFRVSFTIVPKGYISKPIEKNYILVKMI